MNHNRIQLLRQYIEEEPGDPFNVYALAMEFLEEEPEQARVLFDQLLAKHPDYLATYYHAASLYAEAGDRDKAAQRCWSYSGPGGLLRMTITKRVAGLSCPLNGLPV